MNYEDREKVLESEEKREHVEVVRRKSQMVAADNFDYQKLCRDCQGMLECTMEQEREEITFIYDVHAVKPWNDLYSEKKELRLIALLDVKKLDKTAQKYSFELRPENLYYDLQGRVYVRDRDIYGTEECYKEAEYVKQYKALIGCTLTQKYKFEDYYDGGMDLLQEDKFLQEIFACEATTDLEEKLQTEYKRYKKAYRNTYMEVIKKKYFAQKRGLLIVAFVAVAALGICGYLGIWERPYHQAVIAANEAYLQLDYEETIEAMDSVEIARMDVPQKYILAVSCVKCESFNAENQKNILNTIALNGDEKVMEYWIHINRLETQEAADIAMQLSSDQLLYYAYLKEKTVVENDRTLSGEEKEARLSELESKLQPLKDEYSSLTEE